MGSSVQPSVDARFQNVVTVQHPSLTPLCTFHGRIIKTFSSLPPTGKLYEVAKRVLIVALAPLAYLLLGLLAVVGYPFSERITKRVPIQQSRNSQEVEQSNATSAVAGFHRMTVEHLSPILDTDKVSKIKYVIHGHVGKEEMLCELNLTPKDGIISNSVLNDAIAVPIGDMKTWLMARKPDQKVTISGQAFCWAGTGMIVASWSIDVDTNLHHEGGTQKELPHEHCQTYVQAYLRPLPHPHEVVSLDEFFTEKVLETATLPVLPSILPKSFQIPSILPPGFQFP